MDLTNQFLRKILVIHFHLQRDNVKCKVLVVGMLSLAARLLGLTKCCSDVHRLYLLSEFEDASQDRQRIPGSFLLQGYRRNEYGLSPPTRGDVSNYSRGIHGRWDSRSSGWSDKDSDSQSEWDSGTC